MPDYRDARENLLYQGSKAPGFTLVELLIVVIILAVLAAIIVPQFASSTVDAKISALDNTLSNVRSAIDLYKQQHDAYPGLKSAVPAAGCGSATPGVGTGVTGAEAETAMKEQLTLYTDIAGGACTVASATFKFGPYLRTADNSMPLNPMTEDGTFVISTTGNLAMTSATTPGAGWVYDVKSGKFIADDATYADH